MRGLIIEGWRVAHIGFLVIEFENIQKLKASTEQTCHGSIERFIMNYFWGGRALS